MTGSRRRSWTDPAAGWRRQVAERLESVTARSRESRYGTRRRSWGMVGGGFVALGAMFGLVSGNVMAVDFTSANQSYKIYTDRVVGEYAAGYLSAQSTQDGSRAMAQVGFKTADLYGLCAIAHQDLPAPLGTVSLVITGGEVVDGNPTSGAGELISANELYIASDSLAGQGQNIAQMTLGQDAGTLTMDDIDTHRGTPGAFGLQARLMDIADLDAQSYGIDLRGSINLPGLRIRVVNGAASKAAGHCEP
ncbi:DUF6230 family protein [Nocardioides limicola]|uniref:DUF6230 family protein n=1 Tax=Nocardioides limicola TaxID=2803368 RepID=UPI00193B5471|nr:DUF6230 family protein [Nocardioides sp. DJM-14]